MFIAEAFLSQEGAYSRLRFGTTLVSIVVLPRRFIGRLYETRPITDSNRLDGFVGTILLFCDRVYPDRLPGIAYVHRLADKGFIALRLNRESGTVVT